MKLSELAEKYTFHDSLVYSLERDIDNDQFIMKIELCNWAQEYYTSNMDENISVTLTFSNVKEVRGDAIKVDLNGISTCDVLEGSIVFFLIRDYADGDGGVDELQIWADEVTVNP